MAPRKSDASRPTTGDEATPVKEREREGINIEDLGLPRTIIQRLAKGVLPPNTQIQRDAVLAISKSATVFINFLTMHANDQTVYANKKTIMPKDVLEAIKVMEFEDFLPRLEKELDKFNEIQTEKRKLHKKKTAAEKDTVNGNDHGGDAALDGRNGNGATDGATPPAAKKARRNSLDASGAVTAHSDGHQSHDDTRRSDDDTISEDGNDEEGQEEEDLSDDEAEMADEDDQEDPLEEDPLETRQGTDSDEAISDLGSTLEDSDRE
ncbi:MAG: hypothetical protein M1825_003094 [Sarcosagium campestre]|nr:MAG: hypothetical protein M1825_003094 [Sarcosagium campestre]